MGRSGLRRYIRYLYTYLTYLRARWNLYSTTLVVSMERKAAEDCLLRTADVRVHLTLMSELVGKESGLATDALYL